MPVLVDRAAGGCNILAGPDGPTASRHPKGAEWIEIGLLNNMPETALDGTEQQFLTLLAAAAGDSWVHLRFFELPGVPRSDRARRRLAQSYLDLRRVVDLDGLIVTGAEPKAAKLNGEPYWEAFTRLVDWAEQNTHSTIWSCLASHAAVLHLDGIERIPLPDKCFGVFDCERAADHQLTAGLAPQSMIPHSRWNDLAEAALAANGYQVLMRSPAAGVDTFVRQRQSLFLFFQGHPEYDGRSLATEYRRDVGRYLRGEREHYPLVPKHYFDDATAQAFADFQRRACADRREELMAEFPTTGTSLSASPAWHPFATGIYRNWLTYLSAQKRQVLQPTEYLASLRLDKAPAQAI
jgi:homoserine O-succinyltransferase/O-acetyltransferase